MPPAKQKFLSAAEFAKKQDAKYRARLPRKSGPGKNGRSSRVPRALVGGYLYGRVSPAMYAVWAWVVGRGINEEVSDQRHYDGYGVVIAWNPQRQPWGGPWKSRAALVRVAKLLHDRRMDCGIEILSPYSGKIESLPLVLSCGWTDWPRGRNYGPGLRIELDDRVLRLICDYRRGYAPIDIQSMMKWNLATQRLYTFCALYGNRRFPLWFATPEDLAAIMGMAGARRDNVDTAIRRAIGEIRKIGFGDRNVQCSPIFKGKWLVKYEFEWVPRTLDITATGRPPVAKSYVVLPSGWRNSLKRQIKRAEGGWRHKKPVARDANFDINVEATKRAIENKTLSAWKLLTEETDYQAYGLSYRMERANVEAAERGEALPHPEYAERQRLQAEAHAIRYPPDPTPAEEEAALVERAMDGDFIAMVLLEDRGKLNLIPTEMVNAAAAWWDANVFKSSQTG
jgi:hypothetical protein